MNAILALFLTMVFTVNQNTNDCLEICWSENGKLNWSDFTGEIPSELNGNHAVTHSRIQVRSHKLNNSYSYVILNKFIKQKSWTRSDTSEYLLAHEQLHFDMSEVYVRKIRRGLDSLKTSKVPGKGPYEQIIDKHIRELDSLGDVYDRETYHGLYRQKQLKWETKMAKSLSQLQEYSSQKADCDCGQE